MQIRKLEQGLEILTPAKVNLHLEVLGKRSDGFHELETLMCPISLCDTLTVQPTLDHEVRLTQTLPDEGDADAEDPAWKIPVDENNLVLRAARAVQKKLDVKQGCRIHLRKSIPAAAGLGGGSSNAAATVVACMHLWHRFERAVAQEICQALGSDTPFFLGTEEECGIQIAQGRGEICTGCPTTVPLRFILTHPPGGCSTKAIYAALTPVEETRQSEGIIQACKDGQAQKIGALLFNTLQSVAKSNSPWIEPQLDLLRTISPYVLMSGSGSSCFALLEEQTHQPSHTRDLLLKVAGTVGIKRVYAVDSFYCPSIESQLNGGSSTDSS